MWSSQRMKEWNRSKSWGGFTGSFWSWLLRMEGEHSTERPELSECLSLSCNNLPMTDVIRHHGTLGEAKRIPLSRWCHWTRSKIWTWVVKQLILAERVEFDRRVNPVWCSILLPEHLSLATAQALCLYGPWANTLWPFLHPHTSDKWFSLLWGFHSFWPSSNTECHECVNQSVPHFLLC